MNKFSISDRIFFAKRLFFLLSAGISLNESLEVMMKQSKKHFRPIFGDILKNVSRGRSLSSSLALHPRSFPPFFVSVVKAGEESGLLSENLSYIYKEMEKRRALNRKVVGSLVYPIVIAFGTVGLSAFLLVVIFPKIRGLFQGLKVSLPFSTRLLIFISDMCMKYGVFIFFVLVLFVVSLGYLIKRNEKIKNKKDKLLLKIPLIGDLKKKHCLATSFGMCGAMLRTGIPVERTLELAAESMSDSVYKNAFIEISKEVSMGSALSIEIKKFSALFPDLAICLLEVAEKTGALPETLNHISELCTNEIEDSLKILLNIIEPILMAIMGLIVAFISLSIISPIYAITQNIR